MISERDIRFRAHERTCERSITIGDLLENALFLLQRLFEPGKDDAVHFSGRALLRRFAGRTNECFVVQCHVLYSIVKRQHSHDDDDDGETTNARTRKRRPNSVFVCFFVAVKVTNVYQRLFYLRASRRTRIAVSLVSWPLEISSLRRSGSTEGFFSLLSLSLSYNEHERHVFCVERSAIDAGNCSSV